MNDKILKEEQSNLENIQISIDHILKEIETRLSEMDFDIREKLKYISSEKMDNLEKAEMFSEINISETTGDLLKKEFNTLKKVRAKPFFARIDFETEGEEKSFHIGIKSIGAREKLSVLDWRTPVCSLFYNSKLGNTSYTAEDNEYVVNLLLKRQFKLLPDKVVSYIDTDTKIDDNILQEMLSKNSGARMANIVESIQAEQNELIRKRTQESLIIDGVAGSGKTSIAMHRIAYIMFASKDTIKNENILVISPNKLFTSYISDLLPELGEENVEIKSLENLYVEHKILKKYKNNKTEMLKGALINPQREKEINIKFSSDFLKKVDEFIDHLEVGYWFEKYNKNDLHIDWNEFGKIKLKPELNFFTKAEIMLETYLKNRFLTMSIKEIEKFVKKSIEELKKSINLTEILMELYNKYSLNIYAKGALGYEDIHILAYIRFRLFDIAKDYSIKHVFIDEIQDYDVFSLYIIKNIFPSASFTLAGDSNQNILSTQNNMPALKEIFGVQNLTKLSISYRSTYEIMDFSNRILGNEKDRNEIIRHGDAPKIFQIKSMSDLQKIVAKIIIDHPDFRFAILTKTEKEAKELNSILKDFDLIIDENSDETLNSKRIITTIYLSKGLEFDAVLIYNANAQNFSTEKDKKFLYVACTRALHNLFLTFDNAPSKFLPN